MLEARESEDLPTRTLAATACSGQAITPPRQFVTLTKSAPVPSLRDRTLGRFRPVANLRQTNMSVGHDEHHDGTVETLALAAPLANGSDDVVDSVAEREALPSVVWQSIPRRRPAYRRTAFTVSILLHCGAAAVLAQPAFRLWREWELRLPRGHNSVALMASFASPKQESSATVRVPLPKVEAADEAVQRRAAELPATPLAQFASVVEAERVPLPMEDRRPTDVETPTPSKQPEHAPPKQTSEHRVTPRDMTTQIESVSSSASAESSGANQEAKITIVRRVEFYPPAALAAGLEGVVKLNVRVNAKGIVVHAAVREGSGHDVLDRAALDVIYRWQFSAGDDETGAPADFVVPIRFQIPRR